MKDVQASIQLVRNVWARRHASLNKEPPDLARYEEIIKRVKPAVLVETGLYYGASQLWFAERVPWVINVEISDELIKDYQTNRHGLGLPPHNAFIVHGHSHEVFPHVDVFAGSLAKGDPIMVVLDSDHSTDCVLREMELYGQLVTSGSYMVVEDGILGHMEKGPFLFGNWYNGDPLQAIEKFLPDHPEFVPDVEIEDMSPATTNPRGWLKRVL